MDPEGFTTRTPARNNRQARGAYKLLQAFDLSIPKSVDDTLGLTATQSVTRFSRSPSEGLVVPLADPPGPHFPALQRFEDLADNGVQLRQGIRIAPPDKEPG